MNIIQYIFLGHYLPANSVPDVLQTLANFHTSYTMEDLAQVGIEYTYAQVLCIRGLLEKYPTFGREKETGLLGALDT
jgi:hypothetical protein